MPRRIPKAVCTALLATSAIASAVSANGPADPSPQAEVGFVEIEPDLSLRRMVVRNPKAKGTVLLLHGRRHVRSLPRPSQSPLVAVLGRFVAYSARRISGLLLSTT